MPGSGFGRKGLSADGAGQPRLGSQNGMPPRNSEMPVRNGMPPRNGEAQPFIRESDDPMAAKRAAFVAAERLNRGTGSDAGPRGGHDAAAGGRSYAYGEAKPEKSLAVAYILWFFLGQFSAHRIYLGAYGSAGAQFGLLFFAFAFAVMSKAFAVLGLFLLAIWGGWILIDLFRIPAIRRRLASTGERYNLAEMYA